MIINSGVTVGNGVTITGEYLPVTANLQLFLDAGNTSSISSSTTTWTDISGNGRNFTFTSNLTYTSNGQASNVTMGTALGTGPASNSFGILSGASASDTYDYSYFILTGFSSLTTYNDMNVLYLPGYLGASNSDTSGLWFDFYDGAGSDKFEVYQAGLDYNDPAIYTSGDITGLFDKYYMYAFTNDGFDRYMYYSGNTGIPQLLTVNFGGPYNLQFGTYAAQMGYNFQGFGYGYRGRINCLLLYNRALTFDEIQQNFLAFGQRGLYGTTVAQT